MNSHALDVLEYRDALDRVARFAASDLGAGAVRSLEPSTDPAWITAELRPLREMMGLLTGDEGWAMPAIPDLREPLRRLRVEGTVWDGTTLRDAGTLVLSSRSVRRNLRPYAERLPALWAESQPLAELPRVAEEIEKTVDEDGRVRDDASPELYRLRREIAGRAQRGSWSGSPPSRPRSRRTTRSPTPRSPSARGATSSPCGARGARRSAGSCTASRGPAPPSSSSRPSPIELMNRLRELEADEAREVHRILRELTARAAPHQRGAGGVARGAGAARHAVRARPLRGSQWSAPCPRCSPPAPGSW